MSTVARNILITRSSWLLYSEKPEDTGTQKMLCAEGREDIHSCRQGGCEQGPSGVSPNQHIKQKCVLYWDNIKVT